MMKRVIVAMLAVCAVAMGNAATLNVSGGGNALQKAIDKANAGDVLLVEPGTYSAIDTQGKEIEIRSTKGPKQTFITCAGFNKPWRKDDSNGKVWFAALLVSDADTAPWWGSDELEDRFGVEWKDWTPMNVVKSYSTLVGFTIVGGGIKIPKAADTSGFAVNGGKVINCILKDIDENAGCKSMGYLHAAEAHNCLLVARDIGSEIICDSSVINCTVVVGRYVGVWDSPVAYCEILNTILYFGNRYNIDNGSYSPRFDNVVCHNVNGMPDHDPRFVNRENGDYHLSLGSPCIDAGAGKYTISSYGDLNGGERVVNGAVDIGAYEYGSVTREDDPSPLNPSYGPSVPGENVFIAIPALIGYTAKGLPSGLKLNKKTGEISGAAKKPTAADGVIVTFTKKGAEPLITKFIVGPIPTINVTLDGDTEKCKVTGGNKPYLVGAKVNLQAKAPKGTTFTGWFLDGAPWPSEDEYLSSKLKYVMTTNSLDLVAKFEKEKISIDASALEGATFTVKSPVSEGAVVIGVETQSGLKSLKASKLPSGLKLALNKKTGEWEVTGTPKKAGSYEVKLTATAKSGATEMVILNVVVGNQEKGVPYPDWLVGTFFGGMKDMFYHDSDHTMFINTDYAIGIMTISPDGVCSLKWEGVDGMNADRTGGDYFNPHVFKAKILNVGETECKVGVSVPDSPVYWVWTIRRVNWVGVEFGEFASAGPYDVVEFKQTYDHYVQNVWSKPGAVNALASSGLTDVSMAVNDPDDRVVGGMATVSNVGMVTFKGKIGSSSFSATTALLPRPKDGDDVFEAYFLLKAGSVRLPVKLIFKSTSGRWSVVTCDYDD